MNILYRYWLLGMSILCVDRLTKYCVLHYACLSDFFSGVIEPSLNRGLSWSIFSSESALIYWAVSSGALLFFILFCSYTLKRYKAHSIIWPEIMIIAGACSNLIDRVVYGGVVDFISIEYKWLSWPSFNIADVAICAGAVSVIVLTMREQS